MTAPALRSSDEYEHRAVWHSRFRKFLRMSARIEAKPPLDWTRLACLLGSLDEHARAIFAKDLKEKSMSETSATWLALWCRSKVEEVAS